MRFPHRDDAGRRLAEAVRTALGPATEGETRLVLGLPRGGVPVAAHVADALDAEFDVLVVRKLGAPGHEEFAMGAIASGGLQVVDEDTVRSIGVDPARLDRIVERERRELARRERRFRGDRPPVDVAGKTVVIVDDGIATGSTMEAAVRTVRNGAAERVIVAVPLAPRDTLHRLDALVDRTVCLDVPTPFRAVGQGYASFPQLSDDEVAKILEHD